MEVSQEGVPQWRCCFDDQCEAKFESFKALATHVLRHPQTNGDGVQTCTHQSVSSVFGGVRGSKSGSSSSPVFSSSWVLS